VRSRAWVRQDLIAEIKRDLWRYLTPAADIETELLEASALLQLRPQELRTLGRLQFLVSDEVGLLLQQLPLLVRRLATTTASEEEWSAERVRGAIQWGRTIGVRQATGIPHLYVTSPARRAYQTPENELLALVLDAVVGLGKQSGWHRSASENVGRLVSDRVSEAQRWLTNRSLLEVERRPMTPTKLARIRGGRNKRRYQPVLDAYERYRLLAEHLDRKAIREAIETYGIVSRDDATLFELVSTFRIIEALCELGWRLGRLGLFEGALRIDGRNGSTELELTYQATPKDLSRGSVYRDVQRHHQLKPGALRPDLVIKLRRHDEERWLLIEVKGGERAVAQSARAAAYDLLAYRTAFAPVLSAQDGYPYGLGIAWGTDLEPSSTGEIVLCTPDTIRKALSQLVA
jgi:hypothetical protein